MEAIKRPFCTYLNIEPEQLIAFLMRPLSRGEFIGNFPTELVMKALIYYNEHRK